MLLKLGWPSIIHQSDPSKRPSSRSKEGYPQRLLLQHRALAKRWVWNLNKNTEEIPWVLCCGM